MKKILVTGDEAVVLGAIAAGAEAFFGYPITPAKEVMEGWIARAETNKSLQYLQTEDEMAAGFAMLGAILAGKKAFTATAGPGTVLMQDSLSMAENMRLPAVSVIMQRGGPSTGTVIYSQQELFLTCFGGNGEGLRIVYSTAGVQDLYDYTIKAFNVAWKFRFPTFILGDGYQAKMLANLEIPEAKPEIVEAKTYLLNHDRKPTRYQNLRNTYNLEEELAEVVLNHKKDFDDMSREVVEYEEIETDNADLVIFAHGIVASAAEEAQKMLRQENYKVGLFRPITLSPFPTEEAKKVVSDKKNILIAESSLGQFAYFVKANIQGGGNPKIHLLNKPALGISIEEIVNKAKEII
jgi:2-oxoglutarate ferredoxin oxidoreductase subunit alpha